uniref:Uncharacterized protein n=1 Tax=Glossina pallidipes TaxID=7398 RepID=A0A1A9ZBB8_GLOPL
MKGVGSNKRYSTKLLLNSIGVKHLNKEIPLAAPKLATHLQYDELYGHVATICIASLLEYSPNTGSNNNKHSKRKNSTNQMKKIPDNTTPIYTKKRRLPYTLTKRVKKKLDELEKERIITEVAISDRGPPLTSLIKITSTYVKKQKKNSMDEQKVTNKNTSSSASPSSIKSSISESYSESSSSSKIRSKVENKI